MICTQSLHLWIIKLQNPFNYVRKSKSYQHGENKIFLKDNGDLEGLYICFIPTTARTKTKL